jgi:biotin carboxyl carrier protein
VEEGDAEGEYTVYLHGEAVRMRVVTERDERLRALRKNTAAATGGAQIVAAPMPGLLKGVLVAEGDVVDKGTSLCILEAMKMENEIKSPGTYQVRRLIAQPGTAVEKGAHLLELGPLPKS